jgi:hypothetical protein
MGTANFPKSVFAGGEQTKLADKLVRTISV